jgi:hypothetical protein
MRPLILRLFSAAKLLLMFELNKYLFLILNDPNACKWKVESGKLKVHETR